MQAMRISSQPFRKVTGPGSSDPATGKPGTTLTAIIQVSDRYYVPDGVTLRARISPCMFTGEFDSGILATLDNNPATVSVALAAPVFRAG